MVNAKPLIDNSKRSRSKKKKEAIDILLCQLSTIQVDDREFSGEDLSAYADALAGAKAAQKDLGRVIGEAEDILRAAMLRQYADHYTRSGKPPDLRRSIGRTGSFNVIQQQNSKLSTDRVRELASVGVDAAPYKKIKYSINLGKASEEATKTVIGLLRQSLGNDYQSIVAEETVLDSSFFEKMLDIVRASLATGERLDEKMLFVLRVLNPTIQFKEFETDLSSPQGFELAYEFSMISGNKELAGKRAIASSKIDSGK